MTISHPHRCLVSIAIPALAVMLTILFGNPLFATNDDTGLAMIGAGFGMAAKPEPHLVFSHYGYGLLLKGLSSIVGARAHGFATLFAVGFSLGLFTYVVGKRVDLLVVSLLIAGGFFYAAAFLEPQFTITASALVASGLACYMASVRRGEISPSISACIYFAVILGLLIRPTSAIAVMLVTAPAFAWIAISGAKSERRSMSVFAGSLATIIVLAYGIDWAAYYFSRDWQDVLQYNLVRALFNDFQRVPWDSEAPAYKTAGWSHNDYLMFFFWFSNHQIYSLQNISLIASEMATQVPTISLQQLAHWFKSLATTPHTLAILLCQLGITIVFRESRKINLLLFVGVGLALMIPALAGRPPHPRILLAITSTSLICSLSLASASSRTKPVALQYIVAFSAVIASLGIGLIFIRQHGEAVLAASAYRHGLRSATPYLKGKTIAWGDALVWEWLVTPTEVFHPVEDTTIPAVGALSRSPIMSVALNRIGINDLSRSLCTERDISVIANEGFIQYLTVFCEQHYQARPQYKLVHRQAPRTEIYTNRITEDLR